MNSKEVMHVNNELWNQCMENPEALVVHDVNEVIEDDFRFNFGPFNAKELKNEKRFKRRVHNRIIANIRKLKVYFFSFT